ncbi:hypothetical protein Syun_022080 [Stephania yunnanensis]|uniref:Uncharacterized protein n=1 Tax=Stephania yunnanensis TaxID=152371 RepID=A0AAP0NQ92_9MAGN
MEDERQGGANVQDTKCNTHDQELFTFIEIIHLVTGKNAAMVLCWLLGNGCLFAWNGMLTSQDYYVTLFPSSIYSLSICT